MYFWITYNTTLKAKDISHFVPVWSSYIGMFKNVPEEGGPYASPITRLKHAYKRSTWMTVWTSVMIAVKVCFESSVCSDTWLVLCRSSQFLFLNLWQWCYRRVDAVKKLYLSNFFRGWPRAACSRYYSFSCHFYSALYLHVSFSRNLEPCRKYNL